MTRVVGLDVSRGEVTCCVLEEQPEDLLEFARSYRPVKIKSTNAQQLIELGDVFILEPTGSDHRIFAEVLQKANKPVIGVTGTRVRGFAKNAGILNKSDREDAAVIASYGLQHLRKKNAKAFISITASELREHYLALQALKKQRVALVNQIRARLTYECPELHDTNFKSRLWGESKIPRLWRVVADRHIPDKKGVLVPDETVGRGLGAITKQMAEQVCNLESLAYAIECECETIMQSDRFAIYREVFKKWGIPSHTSLAILAAIYPIQQFLEEDGRQRYKRVYASEKSKHNRTTRNRSLKQFKRAIGAGLMWIQSGKKEFWAPTGDKAIRSSLYNYLEAIITIRSSPTTRLLCSRYPELRGKLDQISSKKKQKQLIKESYSLDAVIEKYLPQCKTKTPWREEVLVKPAVEFTEMSDRITEMQLFYRIAPQCQNRCKTEKLMKVYPRFVTGIYRDLVKSFQDSVNSEEVHTECTSCRLRRSALLSSKLEGWAMLFMD
ncbi:MAG: transposase [Elainellaceae cyanobacterium]